MTDDPRSGAGATPPPQRRLMRSRSDQRIAGVAGGIGRYLGVDPVIVRIAFVLLALAGGGGVALYVVCWLLMPEDDGTQVAPERPVTLPDSPQWLRVGLIVVGALLVLTRVLDGGSSLWWGLLLLGAGLLLFREDDRRRGAPPRPPATSPPPPAAWAQDTATVRLRDDEQRHADPGGTTAGGLGDAAGSADPVFHEVPAPEAETPAEAPTSPLGTSDVGAGSGELPGQEETWRDKTWEDAHDWDLGLVPAPVIDPPLSWSPSPQPPAPGAATAPSPRPSPLGRITVALAAITVGAAALLDRLGGPELTATRGLALALLVVGIGCLLGAFVGRGRGLIGVGLMLLPLLVIASTVGTVSELSDLQAVTIRPAAVGELDTPIEIGAGDVVVDLRALEVADAAVLPVPVEIKLGAGRLRVLVPSDAAFELDASMGAGSVRVEDVPGEHRQVQAGIAVNTRYSSASAGEDAFALDLSVGAGQIEVERGAAERRATNPAGAMPTFTTTLQELV